MNALNFMLERNYADTQKWMKEDENLNCVLLPQYYLSTSAVI